MTRETSDWHGAQELDSISKMVVNVPTVDRKRDFDDAAAALEVRKEKTISVVGNSGYVIELTSALKGRTFFGISPFRSKILCFGKRCPIARSLSETIRVDNPEVLIRRTKLVRLVTL